MSKVLTKPFRTGPVENQKTRHLILIVEFLIKILFSKLFHVQPLLKLFATLGDKKPSMKKYNTQHFLFQFQREIST